MDTNEIKQRLDDAQDMLARGSDVRDGGQDATGYLIGIVAELIEVAKAQQAEIERLSNERNQ